MHLGLRARVVAVLRRGQRLTLAVAAGHAALAARSAPAQQRASATSRSSLRNERGALTSLRSGEVVAQATRGCCERRACWPGTTEPRSACSPPAVTCWSAPIPTAPTRFSTAAAAARSGKTERIVTGEGRRAEAEVAFPLTIHERRGDRRGAQAVQRRPGRRRGVVGGPSPSPRPPGSPARCSSACCSPAGSYAACAGCATPRCASPRSGRDAELKPDDGRDEIGDLSRAFATMQARLREQEQARRAFVATASHELRTPLASLQRDARHARATTSRAEPADVDDGAPGGGNAEAQVAAAGAAGRRAARPQPDRRRHPAAQRARSSSARCCAPSSPSSTRAPRERAQRSRWTTRPRRCGPSATRAASRRSCASCWTTRCATRRAGGRDPRREPRCATAWPAWSSRRRPRRGARGPRTDLRALRARGRTRPRAAVRTRAGHRARARAADGRRPHPRGRDRRVRASCCGCRARPRPDGSQAGSRVSRPGRERARAGPPRRSRRGRGPSPMPRRGRRPVPRTSRRRLVPAARSAPARRTRARPASRAESSGRPSRLVSIRTGRPSWTISGAARTTVGLATSKRAPPWWRTRNALSRATSPAVMWLGRPASERCCPATVTAPAAGTARTASGAEREQPRRARRPADRRARAPPAAAASARTASQPGGWASRMPTTATPAAARDQRQARRPTRCAGQGGDADPDDRGDGRDHRVQVARLHPLHVAEQRHADQQPTSEERCAGELQTPLARRAAGPARRRAPRLRSAKPPAASSRP